MIVAIITLAAEKIQRRQVPGFIAETQRFNFYPTEITTQLPLNFYNL